MKLIKDKIRNIRIHIADAYKDIIPKCSDEIEIFISQNLIFILKIRLPSKEVRNSLDNL